MTYSNRTLDSGQKRRYSRNILLEEIGLEGQQCLLDTKILIIGSGALGSIAALYLAGSGVGTIGIADFDTIDISNLQRQVAFSESDTGKRKVAATAARMAEINSDITVIPIEGLISAKNIEATLADYDIVIEGSDNPGTKYLVSAACEKLGKRYCLAGIAQFSAQVMSWKPGCIGYRELFPEAAAEGEFMPCAVGGVCGPLTGMIGSLQAVEAIKMALDIGRPLYNRLLIVNGLDMKIREVEL